MNNNILLEQPKIKLEYNRSGHADFPFVIRRHADHSRSTFGIHESMELLWVLEGQGRVVHDGVSYDVEKGDIIAVNSYTVHRIISQGDMPVFCVIINRAFCQHNGIDPNRLLFQNIIRGDHQATALFRQVMEVYDAQDDSFYNAAFKCAMMNLLLYLCRHYSAARPAGQTNAPALERVRKAVAYIKANFGKKISVDDIAASVGLSKFHFLREFKRITGRTPNHYLNAIRCEYARNLLESGGYSVKEVAFLCGFTNNSYFSNVFCRYIGMLPSQVQPIGEMAKNVAAPAGIYYNEDIKKRR